MRIKIPATKFSIISPAAKDTPSASAPANVENADRIAGKPATVAAMATAPITARTAATLDPRLTTAEENSLALSAFFVALTRTDLPIRYNRTN